MDASAVAALLGQLDPAVWLVTAQGSARRGGLIATFVHPASIVPALPRILVGIARQHHTHGLIEASSVFALHLLGEANLDVVWRFGLRSGHDVDKFEGLSCTIGPTGSPLLENVLGWLDCRVEARLDTGDRTVYLAEVLDGRVVRAGPVLTISQVLRRATADQLQTLKDLMARDSAVDAEAIGGWRSRPSSSAKAGEPGV